MKNHPYEGVIIIIVAMLFAVAAGAVMKQLSNDLSPILIAWCRFFGIIVLLLPIVFLTRRQHLGMPTNVKTHIVRGFCLAFSTVFFVMGARTLDYADAIAILYAYPFIVVLIAPHYLGEKVSLVGWLGVLGGFAGVVMVVRPEFQNFDTGTLWVLACACLVGGQMLLNRKLGPVTDPLVTTFWGCLVATLTHTVSLPFVWQPLTADQVKWLVALAFLGAISQTLTVYAFRRSRASDLAPFTYSEILFAVLIGYFAFGTLPTWLSWVGIALISVSGILVARAMTARKMHAAP